MWEFSSSKCFFFIYDKSFQETFILAHKLPWTKHKGLLNDFFLLIVDWSTLLQHIVTTFAAFKKQSNSTSVNYFQHNCILIFLHHWMLNSRKRKNILKPLDKSTCWSNLNFEMCKLMQQLKLQKYQHLNVWAWSNEHDSSSVHLKIVVFNLIKPLHNNVVINCVSNLNANFPQLFNKTISKTWRLIVEIQKINKTISKIIQFNFFHPKVSSFSYIYMTLHI